MWSLHSWLLASRPNVIPKVKERARDVVPSKAKESHLGSARLEGNTKHHRNDKGTIRGDGRGPAKDGTSFLGWEEDADSPECSSVHETSAEKKTKEEEDEHSVVLGRVLHFSANLHEASLSKSSRSGPNDGNHSHLRSTPLVSSHTSEGTNQGTNACSKPGHVGAIGRIGVGVLW